MIKAYITKLQFMMCCLMCELKLNQLNSLSVGETFTTYCLINFNGIHGLLLSAQRSRIRTFRRNKIGAEKKCTNLVVFGVNRKKFVCEVNSFALTGNSLHWEHDCIFMLPLCSSVNHYYKQVISA